MTTRAHTLRFASLAVLAVITAIGIGGAAATPVHGAPNDGDGPHLYSGAVVDVTDAVNGDVYAAAQSVTISGDVTGDVIAAAQTVTITGRIDGDVRLAGQTVTISGDVSRSATIFAADLVISGGGAVHKDVVSTASTIRVAGGVGRDLLVNAGDLRIDGTVGGDVTYTSDRTARIADGAVTGTVQHIEPQQPQRVELSPWAVLVGWLLGLLYALVALSLITVAAGLLVPRWLHRVTEELLPTPWRALLVGFVAAIVTPLALLLLLVTIIGAPLALASLLIWVVLTLATFVVSAYYLGRLVLRGRHHPVLTAFLGGVILIVALQIPWLNILVWLAMVFFGLGAELLHLRRLRPWRMTTTAEPPADAFRAPASEPAVVQASPPVGPGGPQN
jgi:cytoskeletal protein CcmA (bactofilin family)